MGKSEKPSPSPTHWKDGSKRNEIILEAVRQTDETAISQYARGNSTTKMSETIIEPDRETSETDER